MFPSIHGVVSQGGQGETPDPGGPGWLWVTTPAGPASAIARAGFKFTPNTPLLVTGFRHASSSALSSNRLAHLYAADTEQLLATGAAVADQIGWVELAADKEVVLYPGRPYVLVGGHDQGSPTRIATIPVDDVVLDARVAFNEPATSTFTAPFTFPNGGSADSVVTGVDAKIETYTAPEGAGWAARLEQIGARNDAAQGGWAFTPQVDVTVSKVRVANNGTSANYTVRIWRVSDQTVVASVTFDATGLVEKELAVPVDLDQGVQYVITVARNTNNVIRVFSDVSTGVVMRALVSFDGGRSAGSNAGFPGTSVGYWQGVDMWLEPR